MEQKDKQKCPLFPDMLCPQGEKASEECTIRINGNFDPIYYFRDQLIVHCALNQSQKNLKSSSKSK